MENNKTSYIKRHPALICFIITNLIFVILYYKFVLFQNVYAFSDIGSDTISINYPLNVFFSDMIRSGNIDIYSLRFGLGKDILSTFIQYLNPINLLLISFPKELLTVGIIVVTFIKINLISFFGYKFFKHLIGNETGALIAALTWTFSGYIVLWGQHYGFCTAMMLFTICFFYLQLFLEGSSIGWKVLVPMLALYFVTNYFFFYISGIYMALYVLIYNIFKKEKFITTIKRLCQLGAIAVSSLIISAAALLPILSDFTSSSRTSQLSNDMIGLFTPYTSTWLYTFAGRLLSNNTFGAGNMYNGEGNYYETAILFTSTLFMFALVYLLINKKTCIKTVVLTALCVMITVFRIFSQILGFNLSSQRFSYIICFVEAIAIGIFIRELLSENFSRKKLATTLVIAPIVYSAIVVFLYFSPIHRLGNIHLSIKAIGVCFVCAVIYWIILLFYAVRSKKQLLVIFLTAMVSIELIVANYDTLYDRNIPTTDEFMNGYFNNGDAEAVEYINSIDEDLFRSSYYQRYLFTTTKYNDSMVNGYYGTASYSSTNPSSLNTYKDGFDLFEISDNFFDAGYLEYYIYTLLGGRYLFLNKELANTSGFLPDYDLFTIIGESEKAYIFRNNYALPFGYIYSNEIPYEEYKKASYTQKELLSTEAFYYSDGYDDDDIAFGKIDAGYCNDYVTEIFLGDYISDYGDLEYEINNGKLLFRKTGSSPYFEFEVPLSDDCEARYFEIASDDVNQRTHIPLMYASSGMKVTENSLIDSYISPENQCELILTSNDSTKFRINLNSFNDAVELDHLCLVCDQKMAGLEKLAESNVTDIKFEDSTYTCNAEINEDTGMLCIPILYHKNWKARVDGVPVTVQNINSGLCGISLTKGTHSIVMSYTLAESMYIGIAVSAAGIIAYIVVLIISATRKKRTGSKNK